MDLTLAPSRCSWGIHPYRFLWRRDRLHVMLVDWLGLYSCPPPADRIFDEMGYGELRLASRMGAGIVAGGAATWTMQ
jgi:hypothetical protein